MDTADNIILIFKDSAKKLARQDYEELLTTCSHRLKERLSVPVITALSDTLSNTSEFSEAYRSCVQSAEHMEILQSLFKTDTIQKMKQNTSAAFSYDKVIRCLENRDQDALKTILHRYFTESLSQNGTADIEPLKYRFIEFIIYTMEKLRSSQLPNADIVLQKKNIFQMISNIQSLAELEEKMLLFLTTLMEQLNRSTESIYSGLVQNALHYIQNHFQDNNLALKTLVLHLDVNPAYLGRQFAMETHKYFSDYLNRIRISKAIQLLENTDWKTAAVAEAVGFSNISYFFTVFKKITGGRPGDYRRGR